MDEVSEAEIDGLRKHAVDAFLALLLVGILAVAVTTAFGFGDQARRIPLVVGLPTLVLTVANLARTLGRLKKSWNERPEHSPAPGAAKSTSILTYVDTAFGWLAVFSGLFWLFGTTIALFCVSLGMLIARTDRQWPRALILSVIIAGGFHAALISLMGFRAFRGRIDILSLIGV